MNVIDNYNTYKGVVKYFLIDKNGNSVNCNTTNNTILYSGADILSKLIGGSFEYKPSFIGFIFGNDPAPMFTIEVPRYCTWESIGSEIQGRNCNVLIVPISNSLSYSVDRSKYIDASYNHNVVTLTGVIGSSGEYGFSGLGYKDFIQDNDYVYHTILLSRVRNINGSYIYIPFARASLNKNGVYPVIIPGFSLCVMWDIIFY